MVEDGDTTAWSVLERTLKNCCFLQDNGWELPFCGHELLEEKILPWCVLHRDDLVIPPGIQMSLL
jgi:hypothetical protein